MKALNLIILALAVTLFVACSKKKDGGAPQNNNQYQRYGTTPNDIHGGNYGQMPGYQLQQGSCQGPIPLHNNLGSYCGWLASDGERLCNPIMVRQAFLQNCQTISTPNNYCQTYIRSGCYYNSSGCGISAGVSISYRSSYRPSRRNRDYGRDYHSNNDDNDNDNDDNGNDHGDDYVIVPVEKTPAVTYPVADNSTPAVTAPLPVEVKNCKQDLEKDCKDIKEGRKTIILCRLPNVTSDGGYLYTPERYKRITTQTCFTDSGVAGNTTPADTVAVNDNNDLAQSAPSQASTAVGTAAQASTVGTSVPATSVTKADCLNLQKMNEYILDPKNEFSSVSILYKWELMNKKSSKALQSAFTKLRTYESSAHWAGSEFGKDNKNKTAIGSNIVQTDTRLTVDGNVGIIMSCTQKLLQVRFGTAASGYVDMTYSTNAFNGEDLGVTITRAGEITLKNESSRYLTGRYVGIGEKVKISRLSTLIEKFLKEHNIIIQENSSSGV